MKVKFVVIVCIMWTVLPLVGGWDLEISIKTLRSIIGCSLMEQHLSPQEASSGPPVRAENLLSEECGNTEGWKEHQDMVDVVNHGMTHKMMK